MGRVVLLNRRYCPGEAWTNRILAYAKGFAEVGEEVGLYYLITDRKRTTLNISLDRVNVVYLWESDGSIAKRFKAISFLKNLLRFPRMVKKGDFVLFYGGEWYQLLLAWYLKNKAKVFCEITEHPDVFGTSRAFGRRNTHKINMLKRLDGIFVISDTLKQYYIGKGIPDYRIHVINMFVDTGRFLSITKSRKEKYIAYCGAVSYDKDGVDLLIKAFSVFNKNHRDYKLLVIGKGVSENVIPQLAKLADFLGVRDRVVFTGLVEPNRMPQLLLDASILALARPDSLQARNGFPTKLGEYLATGNPVVVTAVGEIPRFLSNKDNALLAKPGDPNDFARCLCWVAENYELSCEIGLRGKLLCDSEFNYRTQSQKVLTYMHLL